MKSIFMIRNLEDDNKDLNESDWTLNNRAII